MLNKDRRFNGGYRFKKPAGAFSQEIEALPLPSKVTIPLKLRFGSRITSLIRKGQFVQAGQIIARDDETISTPAIASVSGTIEDILQIDYFYGKVEAIVIKSDGRKDCLKLARASEDYERLGFNQISELIYISGAASLGKSGIPTIFKSSPARPKSIDNLIITTFGTGPFSLDEKIIFRSREADFYKGLDILKRALPNAKAIIAMDRKDGKFIKAMVNTVRRGSSTIKIPDWIFIQPLEKKYPQESEDMLVRTILNKKIPIGGLGVDIGVLILDLHDVLKVYEAVALGKPFIERSIALAGSACGENKFINFRIGISLAELLKNNIKPGVSTRTIFGNTMTGLMQRDLSMPVGRSIGHITVLSENRDRKFLCFMRPGAQSDSYSHAFLSFLLPAGRARYDTNMHGELRPCIQCGYCQEVCPVGIIPHILSKQIKHDICEHTQQLGIFECIDCGLCSYVCPCKIPLADDIAWGKKKLLEEGCPVQRVKVKESEEAVKAYRGRMPL